MKCSKCGAELREGQKFCEECGTPVNVSPETTVQEVQNTSANNNVSFNQEQKSSNTNVGNTNDKKKTKVGLVIFIIVAILGLILAVAIYFISSAVNKATNMVLGVGNVIEDVAEDIYEGIEEVEEEMQKELETKIEWKTPFVKIDKENSSIKNLFSYDQEINDLTGYEVYGAIISINYNKSWYYVYDLDVTSENAKVVYDDGKVKYNDEDTVYYYPVYIAVEAGKSIENIDLTFEGKDNAKKCSTSDNKVTPTKGENKIGTYGDCLSVKLDDCQTYIILLDFDKDAGVGFIGDKYETVLADIEAIYITEGKPEHDFAYMQDMFKTVSEDSNVIATHTDDDRKYDKEIFVDDDKFYIEPSGSNTITITYAYPKDSMETDEARKVFDNEKIKLKLVDTTIEVFSKEEE